MARAVLCLVLAVCALMGVRTAAPADSAVTTAMRRADPTLIEARVRHRVPVTGALDLVLTLGAVKEAPFSGPFQDWWGWPWSLGLFLQERVEPDRVYALGMVKGPQTECSIRLLRVTTTDTVIGCQQEKDNQGPSHKFVYDVRAKRLVSHFTYEPFTDFRVATSRTGRVQFVGETRSLQRIIVDPEPARTPPFRLLAMPPRPVPPDGVPLSPWTPFSSRSRAFGASRNFQLGIPNDDHEGCDEDLTIREMGRGRARYHRLPNGGCIGPWQIEGDVLWFGKTYYAGEGATGIGGFGYFDTADASFHVEEPALMRDWSVSAMHVTAGTIWMALWNYGELGGASGGILRYDRKARTFAKIETRLHGLKFAPIGDRLFLAGDWGVLEIFDTSTRLYFVDRTTDGRLRVAEGAL